MLGLTSRQPLAQHRRPAAGMAQSWRGRTRTALRAQAQQATTRPQFGVFVVSGSFTAAEALSHSGLDWLCIDCQHGAVGYAELGHLLAGTKASGIKRIVRVGGPQDQFGIQQALDQGADGVMVPLINTQQDARAAVAHCYFPPQGSRSVAYPTRGVYRRGVGVGALAAYLREANSEVEVWLQVETKECFENIDEVLAVPGITCAFLGPADLSFSMGLHQKYDYDLAATVNSKEMDEVYAGVLQACRRQGVQPGVFCLGEARAAHFAKLGYQQIAFDTDLNVLISYASGTAARLRG